MPTSEDLVPNNLPYGSRQEMVAAMRQAGIPTATSPDQTRTASQQRLPESPFGSGQGQPRSPLDLLSETSPADFPFINEPAAGGAQPVASDTGTDVFAALGASAQSSFAKAVIARLQTRS